MWKLVSFFWLFFWVFATFYYLVSIAYEVVDLNQIALQCYGVKILLFLSSHLVPVQFTEVPQNVTVNTSTPLFLSCDASGFPEPKIRWEKSGIHLSHTKQLNITSSNKNDTGEYVCIASNGGKQEKTVRAYVTVQCKFFPVCHKQLPPLLNLWYSQTYIKQQHIKRSPCI